MREEMESEGNGGDKRSGVTWDYKCCRFYNTKKVGCNRYEMRNVVKNTTDFWKKVLKN